MLLLASCGGSSSTAAVTKVVVSPSIASLSVNGQQTFKAIALSADGNAVPSATFTWSSSATDVAKIDDSGLAIAQSGGTTKIVATDETYNVASEPAILNVMPQIGSVSVTPINATIKVGEQQKFVAKAVDVKGSSVDNAVFQWNISYSGVAGIDSNGVATGVSPGTVIVTASTGGVTSPVATLNVTN